MSYKKLIKTRKNILSSANVSGSFDFWTTIISLDSVDKSMLSGMEQSYVRIMEVLNSAGCMPIVDFKSIVDMLSLVKHEYTHYVDCTSTIWGLKYLTAMSKAYSCNTDMYQDTDEENYHFARDFFYFLRFIRLPKYFTELGQADGSKDDWRYMESIGNRFNQDGKVADYPILFMRFMDGNNKLIVRSPVSTLSILECSAMSQEVLFKTHQLQIRHSHPEYLVEFKQYESEIKSYLHNKNITEYSACAHLVASKLKLDSVCDVFEVCSILCRLVLNASDEVYDLILDRCNFAKILDVPEGCEFVNRFKKGFVYREPGFLFYLMCKSLQSDSDFDMTVNSVYKGLSTLGVEISEYDNSMNIERDNYMNVISISPEVSIVNTGLRGVDNSKLVTRESVLLPFGNMDLPPAYLGDGTTYDFFKSKSAEGRNNNLEELYNSLITGQIWVERFVEAC